MRDTLYVSTKEASGYTMLGNFSQFVCQLFKDKHSSVNFCIDPQFHVSEGKKYTSDKALLQLLMSNEDNYRVLVLWEYKPMDYLKIEFAVPV